ncbi:RloB family protein [Klebsiella oxytoca]|uniref:RloB family protein n=1 Tax=Klebsiella oxytoca TaxID=571 RepID=UPI003AAD60EF
MGSDDIFKKNRLAKKSKDLARKSANKAPLSKILIVCEGLKTEPNYFKELIEYYKLQTANVIDVTGDCGASPMCVVRHAKELQAKVNANGAPYDLIYIVIDKDAHTDYMNALDFIKRVKPSKTWFAINSVPCFEFWLLLHYTYTTKAYKNLPGNSSGNQLVRELKKHINGYEKGDKGIFMKTLNSLPNKDLQGVIGKAKKCQQAATSSNTDNPTTMVYFLVEKLLELNLSKTATKKINRV